MKNRFIFSLFIFFLLAAMLFFSSCTSFQENLETSLENISERELPSSNHPLSSASSNEDFPLKEISPTTTPSAACTATWLCLDKNQKIYRYDNCTFGSREKCKFGCLNDSCNPAPACTVGFKCRDSYAKGYQLEDCSWTSTTKCDYGCKDARCLQANETFVEQVKQNSPSSSLPPPKPSFPQLAVGEKKTIAAGKNTYNLSIYALDPDQVKLQLDQFRSNWLAEGQNYTFGSPGVEIIVHEIYFQAFGGGKRYITYETKEASKDP